MPTALEIHPAIGIARLGPSPEFFLAPEPGVAPPDRYRDPAGLLKRQAARFRVFRVQRDATGAVEEFSEVDPRKATITWTVEVANRKAAAPSFAINPGRRRNDATGDDIADADLLITPSMQRVTGPGAVANFDDGRFRGRVVSLGEIRTDAMGNLLVLGSQENSGFVTPGGGTPPIGGGGPNSGFADNDDWYDTVADGTVRARVTFPNTDGFEDATPAWVIAAPPDFAPEIANAISLYDVTLEAASARGFYAVPSRPSFERDIRPIFDAAAGYAWVTALARGGHGGNSPGNLPLRYAALADPAGPVAIRDRIFRRFRVPAGFPPVTPTGPLMPRLYDETNSSAKVLTFTSVQYKKLVRWRDGTFTNDLNNPPAESLPDALDRIALQSTAGGAFFPGIEASRVLADPAIYLARGRIDLARVRPGGVTAGMAVPWQSDFHKCRRGSALGWWPAQRPDDVFTDVDHTQPADMVRWLNEAVVDHLKLVATWAGQGVVRSARNAAGETVFVETERVNPR